MAAETVAATPRFHSGLTAEGAESAEVRSKSCSSCKSCPVFALLYLGVLRGLCGKKDSATQRVTEFLARAGF
jgi:hypothetical protein